MKCMKKVLSILLTLAMLVSMVPVYAVAEDNSTNQNNENHHVISDGNATKPTPTPVVEPECSCEATGDDTHTPFCDMYAAPENPVCFCVEKCSGDLFNDFCDVCYFEHDKCTGGEDTSAIYAAPTTFDISTAEGLASLKTYLGSTDAHSYYPSSGSSVTVTVTGNCTTYDMITLFLPLTVTMNWYADLTHTGDAGTSNQYALKVSGQGTLNMYGTVKELGPKTGNDAIYLAGNPSGYLYVYGTVSSYNGCGIAAGSNYTGGITVNGGKVSGRIGIYAGDEQNFVGISLKNKATITGKDVGIQIRSGTLSIWNASVTNNSSAATIESGANMELTGGVLIRNEGIGTDIALYNNGYCSVSSDGHLILSSGTAQGRAKITASSAMNYRCRNTADGSFSRRQTNNLEVFSTDWDIYSKPYFEYINDTHLKNSYSYNDASTHSPACPSTCPLGSVIADTTIAHSYNDSGECVCGAVEATAYNLWVGGVQVTSANANDILGDGKVTFVPGSGSGSGELRLNNATITGTYTGSTSNYNVYGPSMTLTVVLTGDNTVSGGNYSFYVGTLGFGSTAGVTPHLTAKNKVEASTLQLGTRTHITFDGGVTARSVQISTAKDFYIRTAKTDDFQIGNDTVYSNYTANYLEYIGYEHVGCRSADNEKHEIYPLCNTGLILAKEAHSFTDGTCALCGEAAETSYTDADDNIAYGSLKTAFTNAKANTTVTLLKDISTTSVKLLNKLTLDLNGKTITNNSSSNEALNVGNSVAQLTLTDSSTDPEKPGTIASPNYPAITVTSGKLIINSGTVSGKNGISCGVDGTITVNGGTVIGTGTNSLVMGYGIRAFSDDNHHITVTITGGTISGTNAGITGSTTSTIVLDGNATVSGNKNGIVAYKVTAKSGSTVINGGSEAALYLIGDGTSTNLAVNTGATLTCQNNNANGTALIFDGNGGTKTTTVTVNGQLNLYSPNYLGMLYKADADTLNVTVDNGALNSASDGFPYAANYGTLTIKGNSHVRLVGETAISKFNLAVDSGLTDYYWFADNKTPTDYNHSSTTPGSVITNSYFELFTGGDHVQVTPKDAECHTVSCKSTCPLTATFEQNHTMSEGKCTRCDYVCNHSENTNTLSPDDNDTTHSGICSQCGAAFTDNHLPNTAGQCICGYQYEASYTKTDDSLGHDTLTNALYNVKDGGTVTLLKDVTGRFGVDGKDLTLDLNSHQLFSNTHATLTLKNGTFTVQDSSTDGGGKIVSTHSDLNSAAIIADGVELLTVTNVTVEGKFIGIDVCNSSQLMFDGATATASDYFAINVSNGSTVTVTSGTVAGYAHGIQALENSIVTINGGTVTGEVNTAIYTAGASDVYVNGGTVISECDRGIMVTDVGSNISITGGKIVGATYGVTCSSGTITLDVKDHLVILAPAGAIGNLYFTNSTSVSCLYRSEAAGQFILENTPDVTKAYCELIPVSHCTVTYTNSGHTIACTDSGCPLAVNSTQAHQYDDGECVICSYVCDHSENTSAFTPDNNDTTHSTACSQCGFTITGNHVPNTAGLCDCDYQYDASYTKADNTLGYDTLSKALAYVADEGTVTLLKNTTGTASGYSIRNKTVTVDLNGKAHYAYTGNSIFEIDNSGELILTDSSTEKNGSILAEPNGSGIRFVGSGGKLTVNAGTITGASGISYSHYGIGAEIIINGGTVVSTGETYYSAISIGNGAKLTVNGGKLTAQKGYGISATGNSTVTVTGGSITGASVGLESDSTSSAVIAPSTHILVQGSTAACSNVTVSATNDFLSRTAADSDFVFNGAMDDGKYFEIFPQSHLLSEIDGTHHTIRCPESCPLAICQTGNHTFEQNICRICTAEFLAIVGIKHMSTAYCGYANIANAVEAVADALTTESTPNTVYLDLYADYAGDIAIDNGNVHVPVWVDGNGHTVTGQVSFTGEGILSNCTIQNDSSYAVKAGDTLTLMADVTITGTPADIYLAKDAMISGSFDKAVDTYSVVVEDMPAAVGGNRPVATEEADFPILSGADGYVITKTDLGTGWYEYCLTNELNSVSVKLGDTAVQDGSAKYNGGCASVTIEHATASPFVSGTHYKVDWYAQNENGDTTGEILSSVSKPGKYVYVVTGLTDTEFDYSDVSYTGKLTISSAALQNIQFNGYSREKTYDSTPMPIPTISVTMEDGSTLTDYDLLWQANGSEQWIDAAEHDMPIAAGKYTLKVSFSGSDVYSEFHVTRDLEIHKAAVSVKAVTPAEKTYDGTATLKVTSAVLNGVCTGDELALDYDSLIATLPGAGVGAYTSVALSNVKLTGADAANYTIGEEATVEGTFTIAPIAVTTPSVTLSFTSATYTGEELKPTVTVKNGATLIPAEEYTVTYTDNIHAGTATVTITDNTGGIYTVSGSATFTIEKATLTITAEDKSVPVYSKAPALTYTVKGLLGSDKLSKEPTLAFEKTPNMNYAGTTNILASGADAGGDYTIEYINGKLTVYIPATTVRVDMSGIFMDSKIYDSQPLTFTGAAKGNYNVQFTYTWRNQYGNTVAAPIDAGTYTLRATVNTYGYTGYGEKTVTIEKATVTVTADNLTAKIGSEIPELTYSVTGLANGEQLKTQPTVACETDMTKTGEYDITASGAVVPNTKNYEQTVKYVNGTLTVTDSAVEEEQDSAENAEANKNPENSGNNTLTMAPVTSTGPDADSSNADSGSVDSTATDGNNADTNGSNGSGWRVPWWILIVLAIVTGGYIWFRKRKKA